MKILLLLELLLVLAIVLVFVFLTGTTTVQTADSEADTILLLGGIEAETIEGSVISMDANSICVSEGGRTLELYCVNPSVKYQLEKVSIGDSVIVTYFDEGDTDPHRYHAYNIEKRYKEPPSRTSSDRFHTSRPDNPGTS